MVETGLFLEGLRCTGCVHRVERALREAPGVTDAAVNYTSHRARLRYDPVRTSPAALVACVESLGYRATPFDPDSLSRGPEREARRALARVLVAAFFAGNVMLISAALYIGAYQDLDDATRRGLRWLALALSLPAVSWCASPFWRGAWRGLCRREITMDVPIVLGIAIAFAVGVAGTLAEAEHLYMDSAAMIVFLILLGRTLESRSRARASGAVERLTALAPETALRRGADGLETVPTSALRPGDRVVVAPGQRIPVDGYIVVGATEVDEALLSGESQPVLRERGAQVTGGATNVLSEIEIEVTAAADAGTLARLASLLEQAQLARPAIQQLADRVAAVFAPSVLAIALLTALAWLWAGAGVFETALAAAAVLIVACPCALGLATPAAVTAAIGRAATFGVLIKRGDALERLARVDTVLLDKTGTVTQGRFCVERVRCAAGVERAALLAAAAAAEGASTHPVAQALREAADAAGIAVPECSPRHARPGRGVEAGRSAARRLVGSRAWLREHAIPIDASLEEAGAKLAAQGLTLAWVAEGARALGVVGLADPPRKDAKQAVVRLRSLSQRVELLSGDHAPAVALAAARAGVDASRAAVGPAQKLAHVEALRAAGASILMVGDGINDAAALAAADVGVAMARGADVALHAADLVVQSPRLGAVADAVELARATLRRIRQNLALALAYNAVAIPLAIAGVLPPLHAAVAMSLSSLVVTGNAARLLRFRPSR